MAPPPPHAKEEGWGCDIGGAKLRGEPKDDRGINRTSALETTKTCDFVAPNVRGGGFALGGCSHAGPVEKYMENTMACMLTFVRVIYGTGCSAAEPEGQ